MEKISPKAFVSQDLQIFTILYKIYVSLQGQQKSLHYKIRKMMQVIF